MDSTRLLSTLGKTCLTIIFIQILNRDKNASSQFLPTEPSYKINSTASPSEIPQSAKIPLYLGAFFPVGGDWDGSGIIPAVEMALDHINDRQDILTDYELRMVWNDTKCTAGLATRVLFDQLFREPQKLLVLGGGCSTATQAIAGAAYHWNLVTMSYAATSPALSNRKRYPYFYRTSMPDNRYNPSRIKLMKDFGWNRVASIHENHDIFSLAIDDLVTLLKEANITLITSESFAENPRNQVENLKKQDAKIIVVNSYKPKTRRVFCEAYKQGMLGDGYVWMLLGYYSKNWHLEDDDELDCTKEEMQKAVEKSMYLSVESLHIGPSLDKTAAGITVEEFRIELLERLKRPENHHYQWHNRNPYGYDATWAVAFMLNQSVEMLRTKRFADSTTRGLEDFTYDDNDMATMFLDLFKETDFEGVSGPVRFIEGDRVNGVRMEQYIETCDEGWSYFDNECLLFSTDELSFIASHAKCIKHGGYLAYINDEDEFRLLLEIWNKLTPVNKPDRWWLGLLSNSSLHWVHHPNKSDEAVDWLPEDFNVDSIDSERTCIFTDFAESGSWKNGNCTEQRPFICRKPKAFIEKQIGLFLPDDGDGVLEWFENITWPGGVVPLDYTPDHIITIVRIHKGIGFYTFVIMCTLAAIGILITLFFLAFNVKYRKQRTVRMSSPSLNNLILIGAILVYTTVFLSGLDASLVSKETEEVIKCQLRVWVLSVGFVVAFGAMFSKTWRAYKIAAFKTPKRTIITDNHLFIMVSVLLLLDVCILAIWQLVDPMFIAVRDFYERDDPEVPNQRLIPYMEFCTCYQLVYWLMPIYAYKGLLLIFGAFLAWETRKVTIPALNDSKLIGISVYNVITLCAIGMSVSFIISDDPSTLYIFTSCIIIFCTSTTLFVIFIPKIISVYKYPEGKAVSTIAKSEIHNSINSSPDTSLTNEVLAAENKKLKELLKKVENDYKQTKAYNRYNLDPQRGCKVYCCGIMCGCNAVSAEAYRVEKPANTDTESTNL